MRGIREGHIFIIIILYISRTIFSFSSADRRRRYRSVNVTHYNILVNVIYYYKNDLCIGPVTASSQIVDVRAKSDRYRVDHDHGNTQVQGSSWSPSKLPSSRSKFKTS